jgi:hypothetical protein
MKGEGMNGFMRAFLLVLILGASAAAAQSQIESTAPAAAAKTGEAALSLVPSDAIVVMGLGSLSVGVSAAEEFVDAIQPGAAKSIAGGVGRALDAYGEGAGIDSSSPLVTALVPRGQGKPGEVTLLPLSDYKAWRDSWKERINTDEASGAEYFEKWEGRRVYFRPLANDSYLAVADDAAVLATAGRPEAALSADRVSGIVAGLAAAPLAVNVSVASLAKAYPDLPDKIGEAISQMPGMGQALPAAPGAAVDSTGQGAVGGSKPPLNFIADAYGRAARELLAGLDEIYFTVAPDAEALTVNARATAVKGSHVEQVFSQQGRVDLSDLSLLPDKPMMLFVAGMRGDALWADIKDLYDRMIDAYAESPEKAASAHALLGKTFDEMKEYGLMNNMTVSIAGDAGDTAMRADLIYQTGEPGKAIDAVAELISNGDVVAAISRAGSVSGMSIERMAVSDETIGNTSVKVITESLKYQDGVQQRMFSSMFGPSIVTRLAAKDRLLLCAMGQDSATMKDLLEAERGAPGRIDAAKVAASTEGLGSGLSGLALVSAGDYISWALRLAMPEAPGASAAKSVPETKRFIAAGWSFTDGSLFATLRVPTEQIRVANSVARQMIQGTDQERSRTEEEAEARPEAARTADLKRIGLAVGMYQYSNNGAMPEDLAQLVDAGMLEKEVLQPEQPEKPEVESTLSEEEEEAAEGMGGTLYYYARLKDPSAAMDPAVVPIAWDTVADSNDQVAVLWLDLHTSIMSPDELTEAVDKQQDLYEETPLVPEDVSDESLESTDLEPGEVESPDMEAPGGESPDMESPEVESTQADMARLAT